MQPEFVVISAVSPEEEGGESRPILAQIVRSSNIEGATLSLVYFRNDHENSKGQDIYSRSGRIEVIADTRPLQLLEAGVVQVLDDASQRVALRAGLMLDNLVRPQSLIPPRLSNSLLAVKPTPTANSNRRTIGRNATVHHASFTSLHTTARHVYGRRPPGIRPSKVAVPKRSGTSQCLETGAPLRPSPRESNGHAYLTTGSNSPAHTGERRGKAALHTTTSKSRVERTVLRPRNGSGAKAKAHSAKGYRSSTKSYSSILEAYQKTGAKLADRGRVLYVPLRPVVDSMGDCGKGKTKELTTNHKNGCFFTSMCANLISLKGFGGFDGEQFTLQAEVVDKLLTSLMDHIDEKQPRRTKV